MTVNERLNLSVNEDETQLAGLVVADEQANEITAGTHSGGGGAGKAVFQDLHFTTRI
jgi:hypothetical protein